MPSKKHFVCTKCGVKKTSPDGKGMPSGWAELRLSSSCGGGIGEGFGKKMVGLIARSLFCNRCFPQDYRLQGQFQKQVQEKLNSLC